MRMRNAKKRQHETVLDIDVKVSLLQRKALQHAWIFPDFFPCVINTTYLSDRSFYPWTE